MRTARLARALLVVLAACGHGSADRADGGPPAANPDAGAATGACAALAEDACVAREDCHATFHIAECRNLLGYCAVFQTCETDEANCLGPAHCDIVPPSCPAPYVVSYTSVCYGPCVRADQCQGCVASKMTFGQADGCANDGSVEFCIPNTPADRFAIQAIAPTATCMGGVGRAGCDPATQLLCTFPTDATTCVAPHGALTDGAWDTLCGLTMLPDLHRIVPTFFEQ